MADKFFNKKEHKRCCCCAHSISPENVDIVLCKKKGIMEPNDRCIHFKYDVLKRIPKPVEAKKDFKPEDFAI